MLTTEVVQRKAGTGSGVSAILPLFSPVLLASSSLERLVHREAWLVPPEAVAECALALVSARLELVGEPPGLVEGAVCGEALHGVLELLNAVPRARMFAALGDIWRPSASRRNTGTVTTLAVPGLVLG